MFKRLVTAVIVAFVACGHPALLAAAQSQVAAADAEQARRAPPSPSNILLLAQGRIDAEFGLRIQYLKDDLQPGHRTLDMGPLLQGRAGRALYTLNLLLDRTSDAAGLASTGLQLHWQLRLPLMPGLQAGVQGFSELAAWNGGASAAQPSHRAGPTLFSRVRVSDAQELTLQAAYLFGRAPGQTAPSFTVRAAYAF